MNVIMKGLKYVIFITCYLFVFFYIVQCAVPDKETIDDTLVWEDDNTEHVTDEIVNDKLPSSIDADKRVLDLSAPQANLNLNSDDVHSKMLKNALGNVDLGKFMRPEDSAKEDSVPQTESKKSNHNYIQKVAKKAISIPIADADDSSEILPLYSATNFTNSDIQWLTRLFNIIHWNSENIPAKDKISIACSSYVRQYLRHLHNGTVWATKMSDSTGRYTSQFFFGNDFWLGSRTECLQVQNKIFNPIIPPFNVHFYVSKFLLKLQNEEQSYNRILSIGLCLPKDCNSVDVKLMLEEDAQSASLSSPSRSVKVISVRAVPGPYSLLADKKLHFLFIILSIVIIFTIIGTCYEISLERKRTRWYRAHQASVISNNNEGDIKYIAPSEKLPSADIKLENGYRFKNSGDLSIAENNYGKSESTLSQLILSFSAISNSKKILYVGSTPEESLTCVHGIRFLSLAWVIMVHTYLQVFTVAENKALRTMAERNFMFQTVSNATFSVDSFFFISGLLVTYLYFKSARKDGTDKGRRPGNQSCLLHVAKFFKLVGYRFLRLTPAYMFVLLIAEISMRWIHNSSVFEPISQNHISCDKYWWRNILYINSLFPMKDMCMLWSWYVSNDTQFYVLGILILLFSIRHFRVSAAMLVFSLLTSWFVTISISLYYDYRAKIEDPFLLFDELYDKPWTRLGPYLVGMFAGWYIFKTKCKLNVSKITSTIAWFLSIFTLLSLVYGLHVFPLGAVGSALYVSVGHTAWGVALAWIVIACCSGHGGFIDTFLSFKLVHPLSRLTYCAYLMHPIIMTTTNFSMNAPLHLQDSIVVILYFGNLFASFLSSFCVSLLFEAPVVRLLKIIFSTEPKKISKNQTNL